MTTLSAALYPKYTVTPNRASALSSLDTKFDLVKGLVGVESIDKLGMKVKSTPVTGKMKDQTEVSRRWTALEREEGGILP